MSKGFIYCMTHPKFTEKYKVGRTNNPERRLGSFQTACPNREFYFTRVVEISGDVCAAEAYVHKRLLERYERCGGEWFSAPKREVERLMGCARLMFEAGDEDDPIFDCSASELREVERWWHSLKGAEQEAAMRKAVELL